MELIVNLRPDLGSNTSTASFGLHRITDYTRHELVRLGLRGLAVCQKSFGWAFELVFYHDLLLCSSICSSDSKEAMIFCKRRN